jgi:hypothetical protein
MTLNLRSPCLKVASGSTGTVIGRDSGCRVLPAGPLSLRESEGLPGWADRQRRTDSDGGHVTVTVIQTPSRYFTEVKFKVKIRTGTQAGRLQVKLLLFTPNLAQSVAVTVCDQ